MPVEIPAPFLAFAGRQEGWAEWLARLPRLVRDVVDEWELTPDGLAMHGECALVVPVRTRSGEAAVAKFSWPHPEAEHEHLALQAWGGDGAVRLLRADPRRWVMLLERVHTRDLTTVPAVEACEIVAGLYKSVHVPALPQLRRLSDESRRWHDELLALPSDARVPRRYVEQAASLAGDFAADDATDGTMVHGDLHYFNVLAAERVPWLVIDPKPVSGEPCFDVAPLLWNRWSEVVATGDVRTAVRDRFHATIDTAMFDEERARDWVVVREIVNAMWSIHDGCEPQPGWITRCIAIAKAVQD